MNRLIRKVTKYSMVLALLLIFHSGKVYTDALSRVYFAQKVLITEMSPVGESGPVGTLADSAFGVRVKVDTQMPGSTLSANCKDNFDSWLYFQTSGGAFLKTNDQLNVLFDVLVSAYMAQSHVSIYADDDLTGNACDSANGVIKYWNPEANINDDSGSHTTSDLLADKVFVKELHVYAETPDLIEISAEVRGGTVHQSECTASRYFYVLNYPVYQSEVWHPEGTPDKQSRLVQRTIKTLVMAQDGLHPISLIRDSTIHTQSQCVGSVVRYWTTFSGNS